jgi:hypothetical protein
VGNKLLNEEWRMENEGVRTDSDETFKIRLIRPFWSNPLKEFPGDSFPKRVKSGKSIFWMGMQMKKKLILFVEEECPMCRR